MEDRVILVDIFDNQIGSGEKMRVHREGRLHRAFSVFLYDGRKMLIQQRNPEKYHSGGLWANACCSHPRDRETLEEAVDRRMSEELGIQPEVREIDSFVYRAVYGDGLSEYEYDHVFLGKYRGEVQANPYELNGSTGCDYCAYRDICGFDPRLDGYAYRSLEKYSKEEVIRRMEEEIENREEPS